MSRELEEKEIDRALAAIENIANSSEGTWQDRKQAVLDRADETQKTALQEFTSWFDEGDF